MENRNGSSLELIRTVAAARELEADWTRLYDESNPRNPFLSHAWTLACLETQGAGGELLIFVVREGERLAGLAPLRVEKRLGFRVLRFISDQRSDYLGFLCADDCPDAEQRLLSGLVKHQNEWDLAELRQLADAYTGLRHHPIPGTLQTHTVESTIAPYAAWEGSWEEFHENGPSWLKRMRKRLPRFLKDGWKMERFTGVDAARRVDLVSEVEARSWKGRRSVTRFQPGPGQALLERALRTLGSRDEMELWLVFLEQRPVAFQINFVLPDRLWIYQQAYDQEYHKASPGSFLAYVSIERAWRAGAREYDYMSGDEPYKTGRTTASRSIQHLAAHPRTLRGRLAYALLLAPRWELKQFGPARAAYRNWLRLREALTTLRR